MERLIWSDRCYLEPFCVRMPQFVAAKLTVQLGRDPRHGSFSGRQTKPTFGVSLHNLLKNQCENHCNFMHKKYCIVSMRLCLT